VDLIIHRTTVGEKKWLVEFCCALPLVKAECKRASVRGFAMPSSLGN